MKRRLEARATWLLLLGALEGCRVTASPPAQIVVYIDTDAPLPDSRNPLLSAYIDLPAPLFDRLRIDVFPPGASRPCDDCSREYPLYADDVVAGRASFGVVPATAGTRLRLRMSRGTFGHAMELDPDVTVEVVAELPAIEGDGVIELTAFLPTDLAGASKGTLQAPIKLAPGRPSVGHAGTWSYVADPKSTCLAPEGQCLDHGAFWMGNPRAIFGTPVDRVRLVTISDFAADPYETSVAAYRAYAAASKTKVSLPTRWSGKHDGNAIEDWCTYDPSGAHDAYPVNCLPWKDARAFCLAAGGDLPTEAQLEFIATAGRSFLYPWGSDDPRCDQAIFARAGLGVFAAAANDCRPPSAFGGPIASDQLGHDVAAFWQGIIYDVAGNLREWTRDRFDAQDGPCWGVGVFHDPFCDRDDVDPRFRTVRGGSWASFGGELRAATRLRLDAASRDALVGFRCVYPVTTK